MKKLFFAFLFLPFVAYSQHANNDLLCKNIANTPAPEIEGDTLYMYITCGKENAEDFEEFVRKYVMIMQMDDKMTKDGYDFYTRILYQQGGQCQTWQVIFIKPKARKDE